LRDPVLTDLFSDAVTETSRRALAMLGGDQPDLLESMVLDQDLDDFIRWEAAGALCCLVRDGRMTRQEALDRLMRQFNAAVAAKDVWGVTVLVHELGNLNPLEVRDEIKAAFDQQLVDESMIDWECLVKYYL